MKLRMILMMAAICSVGATALAQSLKREEVEPLRKQMAAEWKAQKREQLKTLWDNNLTETHRATMPIWHATYGAAPDDGRSLWISLHGGGSAPKALNDQQWDNQKRLYRPAEGVYVAPRAPYDDWDMWFKPALDELYTQLIEMAVAFADVNPDKVYLMGYSAGGDGVWRMAPRMADTWAAASMMAGHPGDVSLLNLRNTPFMIWCGADDAAFNRNRVDAERGLQMDSLRKADPEGYVHETHIMEGMGHWMMRADTAAVEWMSRYRRNPWPRTIVWQQEEVLRQHFAWLTAPSDELRRGQRVRLSVADNIIDISECTYSKLTLWLADELLDLDRPVSVRFKGTTLFHGKLQRSAATMQASLNCRGDISRIATAQLTLRLLPAEHTRP